jgi:hypothetical protein
VVYVSPECPSLTPFLLTLPVRARATRKVNAALLRELAHFIYNLGMQGIPLGPVLRTASVRSNDGLSDMNVQNFDIGNAELETVAEFFGLGTPEAPSKRGYYDPNINAGIQHAAASSRFAPTAPIDNRCSRCQNPTGRVKLHFGGKCSVTYIGGKLLNWGACNECQINGNYTSCSSYRKSWSRFLIDLS